MKPCNQCGKCCILYSDGGLTATPDEIQVWQETNPEIYRYVNNGNIWMDPETGKQLKYCPWLKKEQNNNKYYCSIYLERPDDCRHYPVTISEMVRDECEMIEAVDLLRPKMAQRKLDQLMADSRPAFDD
jgi:Fe-S-cluster containining protein